MKKEFVIAAFLMTLSAGVGLGFMLSGGAGAPPTNKETPAAVPQTPAPSAGAADPTALAPGFADSDLIPIQGAPVRGGAAAPVTLVVFTEFECGFCAKASQTVRLLGTQYGEDLRVVFRHRPLSFHKNAPLAAQASLAAHAQGKFWPYHDKLFTDWTKLSRADLEAAGVAVGLDMSKFKTELDSATWKAQVDADLKLAQRLDAAGAPTFFINGIKLGGNKPIEEFKKVIDKELTAARGSTYDARVAANFAPSAAAKGAPRKGGGRPPGNGDTVVYKVPVGNAPIKGAKDAVVTIVEFSEFQCPYCSKVLPTLDTLMADPAYKGKIRLAFKHRPLSFHDRAKPAARAAMAAHEQGKFWQFHDLVFGAETGLTDAELEAHAKAAGCDMQKWKADYASGKYDQQIDKDDQLGIRVGASGTPHFFVNGVRIKGSKDLAWFKRTVDDAIERAKPLTDKGLKGQELYAAIIKDAATTYEPVFEDPNKPARPEPPTGPVDIDVREGVPVDGPADAKVTIVEFSDFQCPYCSKAIPTMKALRKKYPKDVRVAFMHLPLDFHEDANLAAQASLAAGDQGKFWEYHDMLFANATALKPADLDSYAEKLGLNMGKFKRALSSKKFEKHIQADMEVARDAGASGTPTFYVNGRQVVGALPLDEFAKMVDEELAKAK
jgi:protein-disulfide isomerase